jgi:ABC-type uncharacterized transport system permease subunit
MFVEDVMTGAVRYGASVLFATQGELVAERAGIINLGTEGSMLCGALAGFAVAAQTGSAALGALAALAAGALIALLHAFVVIDRKANQLAAGLAIAFLGLGLTAAIGTSFVDRRIDGLGEAPIPLLADIPFLGNVLFSHDLLTYLALLLGPLLWWFIFRTRWGLLLRATGEDPEVVRAYGHSPRRIQYLATVAGGALAGLGGGQLVLAYTLNWVENATAGRGFVACALVIFAAWKPLRATVGALVFGGAVALQLQLQARGVDVSSFVLGMVPYVLTLLVLAVASWRGGQRVPAGLKAVFDSGRG